jgi:hypothetical protein
MSSRKSPAAEVSTPTPDFQGLVELRRQWRGYHERQDRENADRVFRQAGIEAISDLDLKFFPHIFRQKLNEFGRDWERALASQALREGFSFYRLQLLIGVENVMVLHHWIEAAFGTRGTALFFESNGLHALNDGVWDSIFYFTLKSDISPEELGFESAPGVRGAGKTLKIS